MLLSPMRTALNIEAPFALGSEAIGLLATVAQSVGAAAGAGVTVSCGKRDVAGQAKYVTLAFDFEPPFLQPLFVARIDVSRLMDRPEIAARLAATPGLVLAAPASVFIYDNALALLELSLTLDPEGLPMEVAATALEERLSAVASEVALAVQAHVVSPLTMACEKALDRKTARRIPDFAMARAEKQLFTETSAAGPYWDRDANPVLWTARLYCVDAAAIAASPRLSALLRYGELRALCKEIVPGVLAHVGTTFLTDQGLEADFRVAHRHAQFVYCQYDLIVDAQHGFESALFRRSTAKRLQRLAAAIDQANGLLGEVRTEHRSALVRLQGLRLAIFRGMHEVFSTHELVAVAQERSAALEKRLSLALQAKRVAQDSVVQAILYALGATQLLGLMVSLFDYANATGRKADEDAPGLLDVLQGLSFNATMNVIGAMIAVGVLIALAWRRGR